MFNRNKKEPTVNTSKATPDALKDALKKFEYFIENTSGDLLLSVAYANIDYIKWDWALKEIAVTNENFNSKVIELYKQFTPDGIKIKIQLDNTNTAKRNKTVIKSEVVKLTDSGFPLLDNEQSASNSPAVTVLNNADSLTQEEHRQALEKQAIDLGDKFGNQLGSIKSEFDTYKTSNDLRFTSQQHAWEIDKLQSKIDGLEKENSELSKKLGETEDLAGTLADKVESSTTENNKMMTAGLGMLAGKFVGLDKPEMLQLAGLMLGGDLTPIGGGGGDETQQQPSTTKHDEISDVQQARQVDMTKIYQWMQGLDEENFRKFSQLVLAINERSDLLDHFVNYIQEIIDRNEAKAKSESESESESEISNNQQE